MELGNTIYCLFIFICSGFFINLMVFLGNIIQCPDVAEIGKNNFHLFFHSAYDCFFLCRRRKEKKYEHLNLYISSVRGMRTYLLYRHGL